MFQVQNSWQTHGTPGPQARRDQVLQDQRNKVPLPDRPSQNQVMNAFKISFALSISSVRPMLHNRRDRRRSRTAEFARTVLDKQPFPNIGDHFQTKFIFLIALSIYFGPWQIHKLTIIVVMFKEFQCPYFSFETGWSQRWLSSRIPRLRISLLVSQVKKKVLN